MRYKMNAIQIKWLSIVTMIGAMVAFYTGFMPPYHRFTSYDTCIWELVLGVLSIMQVIMLLWKTDTCYICRIWSDFTLQLTGFTFVLLAGLFGKMYPPFSWAMGVFPIIGILYLAIGHALSKQSRNKLREYNGYTNYKS